VLEYYDTPHIGEYQFSFCENGPYENPCINDTYWIKSTLRCLPTGDASGVTMLRLKRTIVNETRCLHA